MKKLVIKKLGYFLISSFVLFSITSKGETDPIKLPLFAIEELEYKGAFRLPDSQLGESNANWANGTIAYNHRNHSLFFVGHNQHQAISEFKIPPLKNKSDLSLLETASTIQTFTRLFSRVKENKDGQDRISGMLFDYGRLIVNTFKFYDATGSAKNTTIVINDASNLNKISNLSFYQLEYRSRVSGWMSKIPTEWRGKLNTDLIVGFGNGRPINLRLSIGPSAVGVKIRDIINADIRQGKIPAVKFQMYDIEKPLTTDLRNRSLENKLLTELSVPAYGFIVPNTRTYMVVGRSGGHKSGVGYKVDRGNGNSCPGFCPNDINDEENYYWLFDLNQWLNVINEKMEAHQVKPYDYGRLQTPFDNEKKFHAITGASFDNRKNCLWITLSGADSEGSRYRNTPVIIAYSVNSTSYKGCIYD